MKKYKVIIRHGDKTESIIHTDTLDVRIVTAEHNKEYTFTCPICHLLYNREAEFKDTGLCTQCGERPDMQ